MDAESGYGFSVLAEGYLNFGLSGVILVAAYMAAILSLVEKLGISGSIWLKLLAAKLFMLVYYAIRSDIVYVVKSVWFSSLAVFFCYLVTSTLSSIFRANSQRVIDEKAH